MTNCWLRPPAPGVRSMVTVTSPTEIRQSRGWIGAQLMEALEEVAGGVGVVPVVGGVVDLDVEAGLLRQDAGILGQIVAGEKNLEDGIAEGRILFAHGGGGGDAAGVQLAQLGKLGKEGRTPALVAG